MTTDKPLSAEKCLDKIIHEYRRHNVFQPIARGGQVGIHLASEREAKPFAIFQIEAYAAQQCAEKDNRIAELEMMEEKNYGNWQLAKTERNQAIADVKRLREALLRQIEPLVLYEGTELDIVSDALAATNKPEYT